MTVQDLINLLGSYPEYFLVIFVSIPVLVYLYGIIHGKGNGESAPHKYMYTLFIYLISLPGIFSIVLTAYSLFIIRTNLLDVNFLVYFLPIISMFVTVMIMKNNVNLDKVPGFDRLMGLYLILGISFMVSLFILKMRIWLVFGSSIATLGIIFLVMFILLKWGVHLLFKGKKNN